MKKNLPLLLITALFITSCGKELEFRTKPVDSNALSVSTLAGNGSQGSANGAGTFASFYQPTGVATDTAGSIYVADFRNNLVRKISPAGVVSTLAGSGLQGAANGTAINASFNQPIGIAADAAGNVFIADNGNHLIREVSPTGNVTTLAGSGILGSANGTGTAAAFNFPQGVAVDASGNVYVADYGNNMIRKISPAGAVTTLAGSGEVGAGNSPDTVTFNKPIGVALDVAGNIYIADYGNNLIRKITPAGIVSTLAGSGMSGSANGTGTTASFNGITGVAVDAPGNVYVADYGNNLVRLISPAGVVTTLGTGTGASAKSILFSGPYGVAVDAAGNIYVANYGNSTIEKISK